MVGSNSVIPYGFNIYPKLTDDQSHLLNDLIGKYISMLIQCLLITLSRRKAATVGEHVINLYARFLCSRARDDRVSCIQVINTGSVQPHGSQGQSKTDASQTSRSCYQAN